MWGDRRTFSFYLNWRSLNLSKESVHLRNDALCVDEAADEADTVELEEVFEGRGLPDGFGTL